jgi:hypothetical protein
MAAGLGIFGRLDLSPAAFAIALSHRWLKLARFQAKEWLLFLASAAVYSEHLRP